MRSKEHVSNEFLFRQAEVYKDLFDSRGIPNDHEKEFDFIRKHRAGVRRLTGILMKRGELLGSYPDIVAASLGMEEDMQENAHCKNLVMRFIVGVRMAIIFLKSWLSLSNVNNS